ncbi:MAG: hypothetical protein A3F69_04260 [Acidobacteria bacterium RIFCSPLOWO2_12_FULL_66_10]|nr:MAG: hypothetical protein A3F69_04260 [Acidobacteria bacterium RIFCSPLOWO2_12_FULL_66_10]
MSSESVTIHRFCASAAEAAGGFDVAFSLLIATYDGVPVSTTHAIMGAIVGVGATRPLSAVK